MEYLGKNFKVVIIDRLFRDICRTMRNNELNEDSLDYITEIAV